MYKFGSQAPRDLESFGVVGLLGEKCKIFYDSIFTARHIGRVSDLLTARLKELGPDEMRFRIVMMFTLYEAYRCQLSAHARGDGDSLPEPLVIECGVDLEKLAIGVAFTYPKNEPIDAKKLVNTISTGAAVNRFERFVAQMFADSDQVVVRVQIETRRVEVISLLGLPDKMDAAFLKQRRPIEAVTLKAEAKTSTLKADYVELADLDYNKLLKEDGPGAGVEKSSTGQIIAEGMANQDKNSKIKGEEAEKTGVTRIAGVTQHMGKEEDLKLKAGQSAESDVMGSVSANAENLATALKQVELFRSRNAQLQAKIEEIESKNQKEGLSLKRLSNVEEKATSSDTEEQQGVLKKLMKNIWPFNRHKSEAETVAEEQKLLEQAQAPVVAQESSAEVEMESMDAATGRMLKDQVANLQKTIERIKSESQKLKSEGGGSRAQKWADGMVGELVAEKSRINEMAKKLNISFRQKELEFRNKELVFQEEIRKRDEQLKQRAYALDRSKEQVSQMTVALERNKGTVQGGSSEENTFRQKLAFNQKLLIGAKEENMAHTRKIAELKEQLVIAQSVSKTRVRADIDVENLKTKYERMVRQNDEFKRANQQLMEKVNEIQKPKPAGMSSEELKKKLETAMRLAATHQKDSELLRMKLEEMQKTEVRLKSELNRANTALKAAKSAALSPRATDNSDGGSEAA